jgi:hypothetical protein
MKSALCENINETYQEMANRQRENQPKENEMK